MFARDIAAGPRHEIAGVFCSIGGELIDDHQTVDRDVADHVELGVVVVQHNRKTIVDGQIHKGMSVHIGGHNRRRRVATAGEFDDFNGVVAVAWCDYLGMIANIEPRMLVGDQRF